MRVFREQSGAVLIHVAFALMALLAFTTLVLDYGVMWVARRQAQNAADAGALAGAVNLLYDMSDSEGAEEAARSFASRNVIWSQQTADEHIRVPTPPIPCPDGIEACIRVDVFRGMDHEDNATSNPLPTYMGGIISINSQAVRATATAQVGAGNAVSCIKPWVVVDRWIDNSSGQGTNPNGWDQMDLFDVGVDTYVRPGFRADGPDNDIGMQLMLKGDSDWSAGWSMRIELGTDNNSAADYRAEIRGCPEWVPTIGLYDPALPCSTREHTNEEAGCVNVKPGVAQGPTVQQGVDYLVGLDPEAYWDTASNSISGGCTDAGNCSEVDPEERNHSPRIIPLALFNPQACAETSCHTGNNTVAQVVNIMGFFLEGTCADVFTPQNMPPWCGSGGDPQKTVVGRIMNYPGQVSGVAGSAGPESFLKVVRLIR